MRRHILGEQLVDNEKEDVSKVLPKIEEVEISDSKSNNSMLDLNLTRAFDSKGLNPEHPQSSNVLY